MIYTVKLDDGTSFRMQADMTQAAAPISVTFHDGESWWQGTPYQTADARHNEVEAANLVNDYFRESDDDSKVVGVEGF